MKRRGVERATEQVRDLYIFKLIAEDWDGEVVMKLQTKTAHEWVSLARFHKAEGRKLFALSEEVTPFPGIAVQASISSRPNSRHGYLQ